MDALLQSPPPRSFTFRSHTKRNMLFFSPCLPSRVITVDWGGEQWNDLSAAFHSLRLSDRQADVLSVISVKGQHGHILNT